MTFDQFFWSSDIKKSSSGLSSSLNRDETCFFFIWGDCKFSLVKVWTMHIELKCGKTVHFSKTMHYLPKKVPTSTFCKLFLHCSKIWKKNSNFKKTKKKKNQHCLKKILYYTVGVCSLVRNPPLENFFKNFLIPILPWVLFIVKCEERTYPKSFCNTRVVSNYVLTI